MLYILYIYYVIYIIIYILCSNVTKLFDICLDSYQ